MSALLQVQDLEVSYGPIQALREISLEVNQGEVVAVIGANGAGKSTLLRAISGLIPIQAGEIHFNERPIHGWKPEQIVRLGISHVPERREIFTSMSVLENLELGAYQRRRGEARKQVEADLAAIWEMFPILRARRNQPAETLSGGEQQMLAIARGLMARPQLLMLDEPSLGLAPLFVQEILRIVDQLRLSGRTVLIVEQKAYGALQVADRAYLLEVGRIVRQGSSQELLNDERVQRAYLGRNIAPTHRPEKRTHLSRSKPDTLPSNRNRKETSMKMLSESLPNFSLPDEYFQQRLSYSPAEIESIQDEALPTAFAHAYECSPFYRSKFEAAGLTQDSIKGLGDLSRIPFTGSEEIRPDPSHAHTSTRLIATGQEQISLVHTSSGTTGSPKIFAYTGRDISRWAANTATVFWLNGFRKKDIVLGVMPFGEFTGGGGLYLGMMTLGLTYLPMALGPGVTDKVIAHLRGWVKISNQTVLIDPLLRATGMACLASFLPRLQEILDDHDIHCEEISLNKITCGAEPSSDAVRMRFAERTGIWPKDNYGLGEFYGPGVAGECEVGGGLHVISDSFIAEVIDPETGEQAAPGEVGELVLTSLHKEAMPMFRYRTGDRVMSLPQTCPCGIAHTWVGRIPGRISADDIMIPGGVVINRTYLEDILLQVDGAGTEYVLTVAENPARKGLQRLYIAIEGDPADSVVETITRRVQVEYNQTPSVTVLPQGTLPRRMSKARRILAPEEFRSLIGPYMVENKLGN